MFKEIIVELLQKNNITAYKLSKDTGISAQLISEWKKGKEPTYQNIRKLCIYFNVSGDYILGLEEERSNK